MSRGSMSQGESKRRAREKKRQRDLRCLEELDILTRVPADELATYTLSPELVTFVRTHMDLPQWNGTAEHLVALTMTENPDGASAEETFLGLTREDLGDDRIADTMRAGLRRLIEYNAESEGRDVGEISDVEVVRR